jgi:galactose-1-phosphate uridylyltransferase
MKIIYAQDSGILAQVIPAPKFLAKLEGTDEEKLIHLANKTLPTGTKYEITDADLSDRTFRMAWEYVSGASEKTSEDLSLDDQLKYNQMTQQEYDDANGG